MSKFENNFNLSRTATRLVWRYAVMMEISNHLKSNYKLKSKIEKPEYISSYLEGWNKTKGSILTKVRYVSKKHFLEGSPEEIVGDLPQNLEISDIEKELEIIFQENRKKSAP